MAKSANAVKKRVKIVETLRASSRQTPRFLMGTIASNGSPYIRDSGTPPASLLRQGVMHGCRPLGRCGRREDAAMNPLLMVATAAAQPVPPALATALPRGAAAPTSPVPAAAPPIVPQLAPTTWFAQHVPWLT